jgi:PKD repeat protein
MMSTIQLFSRGRLPVIALTAALFAGCSVQEQETPGLTGPSELGLGMSLTASPEVLPRDGSSISSIAVAAFDSNGAPKAGQRMVLTATAGVLNPSEVVTGTDGKAIVLYVAPGLNERVDFATISATPVGVPGGDAININPRTVRIIVMGPSIPLASFTSTPTSPAILDQVTFDASGSTMDGGQCGSACSYSWDFGDGGSGSGLVLQHAFSSSGVFNVTLTVTSLANNTTHSVTRPLVVQPPAAPVANFTTGACAVPAARCFRFTDASTVGAGATITGYVIDFGDNSTATSLPAERTYAVAGTYNVRLTVTDSLGRTAVVTRPVTVP